MEGLVSGWFDLARLGEGETRSISAENPTGAVGGGALATPGDDPHCTDAARTLGKGWKARPCLRSVAPGDRVMLADVVGPGVVQHIWCTVQPDLLRGLTIRVWYDDQTHPSLETPLGDFFANGVNGLARVTSLPVAVNPRGGMNGYWPMPFRRRLRIQVANEGSETIPELFYQITYTLQEVPDDAVHLHAMWRRSTATRERPEHTILDGVAGCGHYVGTYIVWHQRSAGWWGEGEAKFFIDGDRPDAPTICGTGTEDYFGGAWGFTGDDPADERPVPYSGPFLGYPQVVENSTATADPVVAVHGLYRWHLPDPIRFKKDLRVTIQTLGWQPDGTYRPLTDDVASVAYWYQTLPGAPLKPLPPTNERGG